MDSRAGVGTSHFNALILVQTPLEYSSNEIIFLAGGILGAHFNYVFQM